MMVKKNKIKTFSAISNNTLLCKKTGFVFIFVF
jgi:hypothetical protein